ncbi:14-3-3 protein C isoform [Trifolium repens]|nr:14-3-3 protein C isoform [Trifolium repens]
MQLLRDNLTLRNSDIPEDGEKSQKANDTAKLGGGDDVEVSNSSNMTATIYFPTTSIYSFHYFCNVSDCEANGWLVRTSIGFDACVGT